MKKLLILIVGLLINIVSYGQWNLVKSNPGFFVGLAIQSGDSVTAITYNSISHSVDGGQSWTDIPVDSQFYGAMYDIEFPTKAVGYICGGYDVFGQPNNEILKSSDDGESWQLMPKPFINSAYLTRLDFLNADTGFFLGNRGNLFRTIDGAVTLTEINLPDSFLWATTIYAQSALNIFAGVVKTTVDGGNYFFEVALFRSNDLGQQWTKVYEDTLTSGNWDENIIINKLFFWDADNGFAVGGHNTFLKTEDGGLTWTSMDIQPYVGNIGEVCFTDAQIGYINNFDKIQKTKDGGLSWELQPLPQVLTSVTEIAFANQHVGYCLGVGGSFTGDKGFIYKTINGGDSTTGISGIPFPKRIIIFPNPTKNNIRLQYDNLHVQNLQLTDLSGRVIKTFLPESKTLNVSGVVAGLYFLQVKAKEGEVVEKVEIR